MSHFAQLRHVSRDLQTAPIDRPRSLLPAEAQSSFRPCYTAPVAAGPCSDGLPASEPWTMVRLAPDDTQGPNPPDNLAVNGARDAVLQLQVHLRDCVLVEDGGIGDVA